jgi:ectoine hydroxylase-related dioxygenase (phytanoyl-CoA dioxygenase family)
MNYEEIARSFHDHGYAIARGVFSPAEVAELERQLARFIESVAPSLAPGSVYYEDVPGKPIKAIHNLEVHSPYFRQFAEDKRLMTLMRTIWPGVDIHAHGLMYFGKAARSGSSAPAHQDNAFQNLEPPEDLVCTIAIDESTPVNGALCVQRGSHQAGRLPHRASGVMGFSQTLIEPLDHEKYPEVQLCMKPGDICLHHTNTVHYSGPNATDRSRRQFGIGYRTARAARNEQTWASYQAELARLHAAQSAAT